MPFKLLMVTNVLSICNKSCGEIIIRKTLYLYRTKTPDRQQSLSLYLIRRWNTWTLPSNTLTLLFFVLFSRGMQAFYTRKLKLGSHTKLSLFLHNKRLDIYIYIYIYIERERERDKDTEICFQSVFLKLRLFGGWMRGDLASEWLQPSYKYIYFICNIRLS